MRLTNHWSGTSNPGPASTKRVAVAPVAAAPGDMSPTRPPPPPYYQHADAYSQYYPVAMTLHSWPGLTSGHRHQQHRVQVRVREYSPVETPSPAYSPPASEYSFPHAPPRSSCNCSSDGATTPNTPHETDVLLPAYSSGEDHRHGGLASPVCPTGQTHNTSMNGGQFVAWRLFSSWSGLGIKKVVKCRRCGMVVERQNSCPL